MKANLEATKPAWTNPRVKLTKLGEVEVILKAAVRLGEYYSNIYYVESILRPLGFNMPGDRDLLLDFIAADNGLRLAQMPGVGPVHYQGILNYLYSY